MCGLQHQPFICRYEKQTTQIVLSNPWGGTSPVLALMHYELCLYQQTFVKCSKANITTSDCALADVDRIMQLIDWCSEITLIFGFNQRKFIIIKSIPDYSK